jgi:hypothetical protein
MDINQSGNLRVSDADRDRAVAELSSHFEAGRLTMDEFQERSDQALRAKTGADLSALFKDLPRTPALAPPAPVPAGDRPPARWSMVPFMSVVSVFLVLAVFLLSVSESHHRVIVVLPVIIWLLVVRRLAHAWGGRGHRPE